MKLLITGGLGMLGRTLQRRLSNHEITVADLPDADITSLESIQNAVDACQPDVVIHCAAMTAVDSCETEQDKAFLVNGIGSANVALAANRAGARIIAISTDYVFDGTLDSPYSEWEPTHPATVYGASKLAGEQAVQKHCPDHTIIRIAWLYGPGGPSFVHTMMKLGAMEGDPLKVVKDQIGNPTSTDAVAGLIENLLSKPVPGIIHGTCEGECSWYDFTKAIFEEKGLKRPFNPCTSEEFIRPAPRPANSRLEKSVIRMTELPSMPHWRDALNQFLKENPNG